jgi:hypothetical protein
MRLMRLTLTYMLGTVLQKYYDSVVDPLSAVESCLPVYQNSPALSGMTAKDSRSSGVLKSWFSFEVKCLRTCSSRARNTLLPGLYLR